MGRVSVIETNFEFAKGLVEREATNFIVVHHVGEISRDVSAEEIHQWHLNNGWAGIGYHYVIRKNGDIERGRPRSMIGSHCYGHNWESIGVNVVGNFEVDVPTDEQIESLVNLLADLCEIYDLDPDEAIIGHRDKNSTDCPGEFLYDMLSDVRVKVKEKLGE